MANKITDPAGNIDYRYGGETWDSWVLRYMQTIPYIFEVLNALNGTGELSLPLPDGAGALVRKNADGTVSISITGNAATATNAANADMCTGNAATADKWKTPRKMTLTGDVSGEVTFDGSANVVIPVECESGNASKIINKLVDGANITDGSILVYRQDQNKFMMESKGTVGSGKTLRIYCGDELFGSYNGDLPVAIDLGPALDLAVRARSYFELDSEGNLMPKA